MVIKENWFEKVAGFKRILLNCLSSGDTSTTFPILIPLGYTLSRPEVTNVSDLTNGTDAIEERTRHELGMVKSDEFFFQVPNK